MKKMTVILLVLLVLASFAFATGNRVQALGNNTFMLPGDDASIQLFPQRINDMNLVSFQSIHLASPNYLLVVGEPGKTWGFYGGASQRNDYFNLYRSLGENSALRMGLRLGIDSHTDLDDDKEATPTTSEETVSETDVMVDLQFGTDRGDTEYSVSFTFGLTPATIGFLGVDGTFNGKYDDPILGNTTSEGKASRLSFGLQVNSRSNKAPVLFENSYAVFGLYYQGDGSELTNTTNVKVEDDASSSLSLYSSYGMFNNTNLADDKIFLVYGLRGSLSYFRSTYENLLSGSKTTFSTQDMGVVAPIFNLGLEAKLKYATLRFGVDRRLTAISMSSTTNEYDDGIGTTDNEDSTSDFVLGNNGSYSYNAGMGFNYGSLQLDILVNSNFWLTGPQMIFNDNFGSLGVSADLVYTF